MVQSIRFSHSGGNAVSAENDPISLIRRTLRNSRTASLGTLDRGAAGPPGAPFVSLVQVAARSDGAPTLLLSKLAEHTQNALGDPRASLLFDGTQGLPRPLTGPRVTLQGSLVKTTDQLARDRYLAKHPEAFGYVGFPDFAFYVLVPVSAHLVAGFGAIHWLPWADIAPLG
jgi:putative heme iron utilization protein